MHTLKNTYVKIKALLFRNLSLENSFIFKEAQWTTKDLQSLNEDQLVLKGPKCQEISLTILHHQPKYW